MTGTEHRQLTEGTIEAGDVAELARGLGGDLVLPSDPGYDAARAVWNGAVDRRPAAIAYCTGPQDVIESLHFARTRKLPFSVRAGGHNVAGNSVRERGLVIDLSRMKDVTVDPLGRVAVVQAGLDLGELDRATQAFALATTLGVNSDTGVAGLTLGGGFGRLGRKHGLACDNLLSADVVTADGRLIHASEKDNPDLFWGIRGGGGNFGIATSFEFRLHPLGPQVLHASLTYDFARLRDALHSYHELAASAPDEVSADAALVSGSSGTPLFNVSITHVGASDEGTGVLEQLMTRMRSRARPVDEQIGTASYVQLQSAGDSVFPRGRRYYWKAQFFREIDDDAIDALAEMFPAAPSPRSMFIFQHVGGAIARVPPDATAYANRDALYDGFPISIWESPREDEANIAWARDLWAALAPSSTGGVYANNLGDEGNDRVRAAYGPNHARLAALKTRYDPSNLFCMNQNVTPHR